MLSPSNTDRAGSARDAKAARAAAEAGSGVPAHHADDVVSGPTSAPAGDRPMGPASASVGDRPMGPASASVADRPMRPADSPPRPLSGLATMLDADTSRSPHAAITGVSIDSRKVRRGDLYVALPGNVAHGAAFSAEAMSHGAAAILTDPAGHDDAARTGLPVLIVPDPRGVLGQIASWVYGQPAHEIAVIGVTGTSGKSTSTFMLEAGLRAAGHTTGLIGGVEIHAGDLEFAPRLTTPEASELHGLFALMRERGVSAATMEVSSHALALGRVDGLFYDVALFTNLSQDHLDFHKDLDDYFLTKARLFQPEFSRVGVTNLDDAHGRELLRVAKVPMTTFSPSGSDEADWRAVDVRLGADGSTFRVLGPGGIEADVEVALPGPFNVANALGAIVALVEAGVSLQAAVTGVGGMRGVPGRMERVTEPGHPFQAIVDYSHKPGAVESVLGALREVTTARLTVVLGCGGDRDSGKRPLMGEAAARLADVAIFTSDNPRSEDPLAILVAMMDGALRVPSAERAHVIVEPDRRAAIGLAIAGARQGDVVVVAGKGHEQGQYIAGEVIPFDDREVVAEALRKVVP